LVTAANDKSTQQELFNYEMQIEKTKGLMVRLEEVLNSIDTHGKFLSEQYDVYKSYLDDVTEKCGVRDGQSSGKNKGKAEKGQKVLGPYKYSYTDLEKSGIIKESEVPKDR